MHVYSPIPNLKTLRREVRAGNREANRCRTRIDWKFDRKAARRGNYEVASRRQHDSA
jgi:hypothetical protein